MPKKGEKVNTKDRIDCLWGLLCSQSSIDQQKNNISLFNVIEQLNLPKEKFDVVPDSTIVFQFNHELVFVWRRLLSTDLCEAGVSTDVKISSIDPDGKKLGEMLTQVSFDPKFRNSRFRIQNGGFNITKSGDYVYKVEIVQPGTSEFELAIEVPYTVQFI